MFFYLSLGLAVAAVASRKVGGVSGIDHALEVLEVVVDRIEYKHERTVGDEVASTAVSALAEEVVESAAAVLFDEVGFLCLDLGVIDIHIAHICGLG